MICGLNVAVSDSAEKSVDDKPALNVMPDPGEGRIELFSKLFLVHGAPHHLLHLLRLTLLLLVFVCSSARQAKMSLMSASKDRSKSPSHSHPGPAAHKPVGRRIVKVGRRQVITEGIVRPIFHDLFHHFMTVSWPRLFATLAAFFIVFDLLFGFLYYLAPGCIANLNPPGFAGDFFFSVETLATVGYGEMHPATFYGHLVAMIEIFVGLMSLALITGLMFARFSRPQARFLFTRNAVVRPVAGKPTLIFRAANERQNVVQDASASLRMLRDEVTEEGYRIRRIVDLPLLRSQHPMFTLSWSLMHVIDDASPLSSETAESLSNSNAVFILSLSGTDENTGQTLMARSEYSCAEIRWNFTFHDILEEAPDGSIHVDYNKFHDIEPLQDSEAADITSGLLK
jgi:inward rectifier potassium channel